MRKTLQAAEYISAQRSVVRTVLLVEDNPDDADLTKRSLRKSKFNVLHASTGEEAVHLFRAYPALDIVLMDLNLPRMSGIDVARQLLALNPSLVICVLTGSYTKEARHLNCAKLIQEALELGLTVIPKPLDVNLLSNILSGLTGIQAVANRSCFSERTQI